MDFVTAVTSLFFLFNSFGNIPLFLGVLKKYPPQKQRLIIFRECLISLAILIMFSFFGDWILASIGINHGIMKFTGGFILVVIAAQMLFPRGVEQESSDVEQEPFIIPLAFPAFAGPGSIANVMILAGTIDETPKLLSVILVAWALSTIVLLCSSQIKRLVGNQGMMAFQKLGGLIVALIAVSMITGGAFDIADARYFKVPSKQFTR